MTFFRIVERDKELFLVESRNENPNWEFLTQFLNYSLALTFLEEIKSGVRDKKGKLVDIVRTEIEI